MKLSDKTKLIFKIAFIVLVVGTIGMFWYDEITYYFFDEDDTLEWCPRGSNVAVIKIYGEITGYPVESEYLETTSEYIVEDIDKINQDDDIRAIVVEIDSWGGEPVASEEIYKSLKRNPKPTVALIKGIGASGAYLVALGTDKIYASKWSEVGSIGVTMSYLDNTKKNEKEGIIYQQLSSGKFKDTRDPDKELTNEERELLMRDIMKMHQLFIEMVAENRGLDVESVEKLADGSTLIGDDAKEAGLIDAIGDIEDVKQYLRYRLDIVPILCEMEL